MRDVRLVGARVTLREVAPPDLDAIHAFASDAQLLRFTDWGPNTLEDTRDYVALAQRQAGAEPRTTYALAVTAASGELVGTTELRLDPPARRSGELGYTIHPAHAGLGYATDTTRLLLELAFGQLGLHRVWATCHPDNLASARVLAKAGMRQEGHLRQDRIVQGAWRDSLLWAVLESDPRPPAPGTSPP